MLHSRTNKNKIKHLHESCLRLIYSDKKSSHETPLGKDGSVSVNHKNIQTLSTVMFKVKHYLVPEYNCNIFIDGTKFRYNLLYRKNFGIPLVKSVYHGIESIAYLGPKIWDIALDEIKKKLSVNSFQESI